MNSLANAAVEKWNSDQPILWLFQNGQTWRASFIPKDKMLTIKGEVLTFS